MPLTTGTAMFRPSDVHEILTAVPDPVDATERPHVYAFVRSHIPMPQPATRW